MSGIISIVAAVIRDEAGQMLVVRKRGTDVFMQPGGKSEPGEEDIAALARELNEELGCRLVPETTRALGRFGSVAANEPGWRVEANVYAVEVEGSIEPQAEIAEMRWIGPTAASHLVLAPLIRDHILPLAFGGVV